MGDFANIQDYDECGKMWQNQTLQCRWQMDSITLEDRDKKERKNGKKEGREEGKKGEGESTCEQCQQPCR